MFCSCPQNHFGKKPNTTTCPICLGLPGALPLANSEAIFKTVKLGLALGAKISKFSRFYRKHYFYPDLPKAFQTSQKDEVLCIGGQLLGKEINHIHLEEDAGKLVHETIDGKKFSLVDFNRSGCALIELVTEPVFRNIAEVLVFVKELQLIARYLDISGADMEKGTMRLEGNISVTTDSKIPDYKVELKNINSFRFLEKALTSEIERQIKALEAGEKLIQETRGYDEVKQTTFPQRSKEESQDYRYFPEADLPPIQLGDEMISKLKSEIPELPVEKRIRFKTKYGLSNEYINVLVSDIKRSNYFEDAAKLSSEYRTIASLMINKKMDKQYPEAGGLIKKILELTKISYSDDASVDEAVLVVISKNPDVILSYKNGKGQVIGFLIGQVQKILHGKGDPKFISLKLIEKIKK